MLELIMFFVGILQRSLKFLQEFIIIPSDIPGVGGVNMLSIIIGTAILGITIRQLVIGTRDSSGSSERTTYNTYHNTNPTYNITKSKGDKK
jgi:hypothetical protein